MKKIFLLVGLAIFLVSFTIVGYAAPYNTETDDEFEYYCSTDDDDQAYALIDDYFGEDNDTITSIIIPAISPGGKPVRGIQMHGNSWGSYITSITLPSSLNEVSGKFNTAPALTEIIIPEEIDSIGQGAFDGCRNLTILNIPSSITNIGDDAFNDCEKLMSINVDADNLNYKSVDGVLFSKDGTTLLYYPDGKTDTSYIIPAGVTNIEAKAFDNCDILERITIGDDVTTIGASAFYDCSKLNNVVIPEGVTDIGGSAFSQCDWLSKLTILNKNTNLGMYLYLGSQQVVIYCYENSTAHTYVIANADGSNRSWHRMPEVVNKIPSTDGVKDIAFSYIVPNDTFNIFSYYTYTYSASGMPTGVTFDNNTQTFSGTVSDIGSSDITVTMMESGNSISDTFTLTITENIIQPEGDFSYEIDDTESYIIITGYTGEETNLVIPNTFDGLPVKEIAYEALKSSNDNHSSDIISVTLPNTITKIGESAFEGCSSLESINIPIGVTDIGARAFNWCTELNNIVLPNTMTELKSGTFMHCKKLSNLNLAETITKIGSQVFFSCFDLNDINTLLVNITEIGTSSFSKTGVINLTIPVNLKTIGNNAFYMCGSLETVEFDEIVSTLGSGIFQDCGNLKSVVLPNEMIEIPNKMFMNSSRLASVNIPNTIIKINNQAFENCDSLTNITLPSSLTEIDTHAFENIDGLAQISLPSGVNSLKSSALKGLSKLEDIYIYNDNIVFQDNDTIKDCSENLKIHGNSGSSAESYANTNNITFVEFVSNTIPTVANEIPDKVAKVGVEFTYVIPESTFEDLDNDVLTYSMTTSNSAITFNSVTRNVVFTPNQEGIESIKITATDESNESTSDIFDIIVTRQTRPNSGGSSSGESTVSGSVPGAKTIYNSRIGKDVDFTIDQEDVKVTFNGLAFNNLKNKNIQAKIKEMDKSNLNLSDELLDKIGDFPIFDISIYVDGDKTHFESEEPITIEIPIDTDLDSYKIVGVYIDDNGNIEIMEGVAIDGFMKFSTHHLSEYALIYMDKTFDDITTHWGKEAIEALASRELINGVGNDFFNPNGEMTRMEFTNLVVRYFDLKGNNKDNYSDVEENKWYTENIAVAKDNNILPNIYGDLFEPTKVITREEMMYIVYKGLEITNKLDNLEIGEDKLSDFKDSENISDYAVISSEYLVKTNVIDGSNDMINPISTTTRAEVVQMLYNLLKLY